MIIIKTQFLNRPSICKKYANVTSIEFKNFFLPSRMKRESSEIRLSIIVSYMFIFSAASDDISKLFSSCVFGWFTTDTWFHSFFVFQAQKPHSITNSSISPKCFTFWDDITTFFSVAIWNTAGVSPHFRLTTHDRLLDSSRLCVSHNFFFMSSLSNAELVVEQTKVLLRPANSHSKMITREMWHSNYQFFFLFTHFFSLTEECDDDEVDGRWRNVCKSWICRESSDKECVYVLV